MANAFHAYMTLPGSLARLATGWSRPRLQPNHPSSETQGMVCQRVCPISQSCVVAARARQTCLVSLGNPEKQIGFQNPRRLDQKCHVPAISPCTASACRLHLGPGSTPLPHGLEAKVLSWPPRCICRSLHSLEQAAVAFFAPWSAPSS